MRKFILLMVCWVFFKGLNAQALPDVWINEVHYNNTGTDILDGYEIAGTAGTDLACFEVFIYNGATGEAYLTDTLSGTLPNQQAGYGTLWFGLSQGALQNTSNIGYALVYAPQATACGGSGTDALVQFLSFGGSFTALNGGAQGQTSTNTNVSESSSTAVGSSLQLGGIGDKYSDFAWQHSLPNTYNFPNTDQTFVISDPQVYFIVDSSVMPESWDSLQIAVGINYPNMDSTQVDINVVPGGTAQHGVNFTYQPITVTFPANSPVEQFVTVYSIDDSIPDGNKFVTFRLNNATNNATILNSGQTYSESEVILINVDTPKINIDAANEVQYENIGTIQLPVSLNRGCRDTTRVNVNLVPAGTTATQGLDFYFNDTTIAWNPDVDGIIYVPITIINNPYYEPQRTIELSLSNPTNHAVFLDSTFILTIEANSIQSPCSDLFFGQYVQGSGNNQALQIYNPTDTTINLAGYQVVKSINGGATFSSYALSGTIAPGGVYVLANPLAGSAILTEANATSAFFNFDGTEALALVNAGDTIDIIGQLYVNPGVFGWPVGNEDTGNAPGQALYVNYPDTGYTIAFTLIRNYFTYNGNTVWDSASSTWEAYPEDMFDSLAFHHTASCGTPPYVTAEFTMLNDTVPQPTVAGEIDTFLVTAKVVNPTNVPVTLNIQKDFSVSTGRDCWQCDFFFAPRPTTFFPGVNYVGCYLIYFNDPSVLGIIKSVIKFYYVPSNVNVINDSVFTLYVTNQNKLTVSFLGAGYSYPKDTSAVAISLIREPVSLYPVTADITLSTCSAVEGTDFLFNDTTVTFPAYSTDTQAVWVTLINNNILQPDKQINFNLSNPTGGAQLGITGFTLTIIEDNDTPASVKPIVIDSQIIYMYPDPVINLLNIENTDELDDVSITDIAGRLVVQVEKLPPGGNSISAALFPPGMYIINITKNGKHVSRSFVKI